VGEQWTSSLWAKSGRWQRPGDGKMLQWIVNGSGILIAAYDGTYRGRDGTRTPSGFCESTS
jgi:hypothetical protein